MKINRPGSGVQKPAKAGSSKKASKSGKKSSASKSSGAKGEDSIKDMISVSGHEETLDLIRGMVNEQPDVRVEEVDRIVGELKGGKYKIDFEKVAEGFIKEAIVNEMTKKQRKKG